MTATSALDTGTQALLQRRADLLAQPLAKEDASTGRVPMTVFSVGASRFAVSVESLKEVRPLRDIAALPMLPPHLNGLAAVGGRVLVVLDLRPLLDLPQSGLAESPLLLVVGEGKQVCALLATKVEGLRLLDPAQALEWPAHRPPPPWLLGVIEGELLHIDVNQLLSDPALGEWQESTGEAQ
jgi:chemotaxis signal transduction protein